LLPPGFHTAERTKGGGEKIARRPGGPSGGGGGKSPGPPELTGGFGLCRKPTPTLRQKGGMDFGPFGGKRKTARLRVPKWSGRPEKKTASFERPSPKALYKIGKGSRKNAFL